MDFFVTLFLSVVFLVSGLALQHGDRIVFYLVLIFPFILFFRSAVTGRKIFFPKKLSVIWLLFGITDLYSAILSSDREVSFERFLLYQSAFFIFIYFYNNKKNLGDLPRKIIFSGSFVFISAFILKGFLLKNVIIFDVHQLFNFFLPVAPYHNSLGVWLGMSVLLSFAGGDYLSPIFFLPFFLVSSDRSAYFALYIALIIFFNRKFKLVNNRPLFYVSLFLSAIVFVLAVYIFVPRFEFLSGRINYAREAIAGFLDRPLTGYGPGNFETVSRKYAAQTGGVYGSIGHNLYLDILSGGGLLSFIFFITFILKVLLRAKKGQNYYLFIYFLVLFSTHFIYPMPALIVLFFISAGLIYEEKGVEVTGALSSVLPLFLFLFSLYLGYSEFLFMREDYRRSLDLYPYRKEAYIGLISQIDRKNTAEIYSSINSFKRYFPDSFEQLNFSVYIYENTGDLKKSIHDRVLMYENGSGLSGANVKSLQKLYLLTGNPVAAYKLGRDYTARVIKFRTENPVLLQEICNNFTQYLPSGYVCR